MSSAWMRGQAMLRSSAGRRRHQVRALGVGLPPRVRAPSELEVGVVFLGIGLALAGWVVWMDALIGSTCGGGYRTPTQRSISRLDSLLYDLEPYPGDGQAYWADLRADYEQFARRRSNRVNVGVEWIALRYYDHPRLAELPRGDGDGDATPMGQFTELLDEWDRPLVVMLPWEDEVRVGTTPGAPPILFARPPEVGDDLVVFSTGPDGIAYTRDDVHNSHWWDLK